MGLKLYIKQDDTDQFPRARLCRTNAEGTALEAINLTGATVKFIMKEIGATATKVDATLAGGEIIDAVNGLVEYWWEAADTDTVGSYLAEFEITFSNGRILTCWDERTLGEINKDFSPEPFTIIIVEDLG